MWQGVRGGRVDHYPGETFTPDSEIPVVAALRAQTIGNGSQVDIMDISGIVLDPGTYETAQISYSDLI
jgi:hypothetical protein